MRDELVVDSAEQLRALAHPARLRILNVLATVPMTNKQIAEALGEPPARVHFHVRELHDAGFIDLVEERPKGGVIEKYYRAAARHLRVSPPLGDRGLLSEGLMDATLEAARKELAHAAVFFHGPPPGMLVGHEQVRLSDEALARVHRHIRAIEEEMQNARRAPDSHHNIQPVAFTYLLHPIPTAGEATGDSEAPNQSEGDSDH